VVAMELAELVARDSSEPEEERHRGQPEVGVQILPGFEVRILKHIGGVDSPLEPLIEWSSVYEACAPEVSPDVDSWASASRRIDLTEETRARLGGANRASLGNQDDLSP